MRKIIWMFVFGIIPISFVKANALFDCPDITIEVDNDELEIDNLSAPIEIVKIFNASYNLVYQCNSNCPDEIELKDLSQRRILY